MRLRDGRHPVGDAGTGSEHGQPGPAGEPGVALGGEGGGLLVPHVDDAGGRIALDRGVVQREDVPTDRVNSVSTPKARRAASASSPPWSRTVVPESCAM